MRLHTNAFFLWLLGFGLFFSLSISAQGNCEAMAEGSKERLACEYGRKAITYKQGSKASQLYFDSAIAVNPDYAWAWFEKSIPYLKRGMLTRGMTLLNNAVELDPLSYLCYRAYWYFQHKSYAYCSADLERYYAMEGAYTQNTPGGALDMRIVLGINYAHLGANDKAIEQVRMVITSYPTEDHAGPYDFHTLGVLYLNNGQYEEAREALRKSIQRNEQFADTWYYLAELAIQTGDLKVAKEYLAEALIRYEGEKNGYTGYPFCFPVSKEMAENRLKELQGG